MRAAWKASRTFTVRSSGSTAKSRFLLRAALVIVACFPSPPPEGSVPSCAEGGVLGVFAGIVGTWQAAEALKPLCGSAVRSEGRLLLIDALDARVREIAWRAIRPVRSAATRPPSVTSVISAEAPRGEAAFEEIAAAALDEVLASHPGWVLLDVREPHEAVLGLHERSLHLPASQLERRMHELDSAKSYVVACRVGARSRWAMQRLHDAGFRRLYHLRDGLLAYAATESFEMF